MLSTTQIIQLVLLAAIFAAAVSILAGRPKSAKGIASGPLFFISASLLFLGFVVTEAVFFIYYLKFIMGYGVNAGLLSAAVVVLLFIPFTGYTQRAFAVIRSIPFKLAQPERKAEATGKQIKKPLTIVEEDKPKVSILTASEVSGEQIAAVMEVEEKENSIKETDQAGITEVVPVNPAVIVTVQNDVSDVTSKTDKSTAGSGPRKKKPGQRSAPKKQQGSHPQQKTTGGKTRGRKKK